MPSHYYSKKDYEAHICRTLKHPSKVRVRTEGDTAKEALRLLALGWTQSQVARYLNVTRQRIGQIYLKHLTLRRQHIEKLPTKRLTFLLDDNCEVTMVFRGEITAERLEKLIEQLERFKRSHATTERAFTAITDAAAGDGEGGRA